MLLSEPSPQLQSCPCHQSLAQLDLVQSWQTLNGLNVSIRNCKINAKQIQLKITELEFLQFNKCSSRMLMSNSLKTNNPRVHHIIKSYKVYYNRRCIAKRHECDYLYIYIYIHIYICLRIHRASPVPWRHFSSAVDGSKSLSRGGGPLHPLRDTGGFFRAWISCTGCM